MESPEALQDILLVNCTVVSPGKQGTKATTLNDTAMFLRHGHVAFLGSLGELKGTTELRARIVNCCYDFLHRTSIVPLPVSSQSLAMHTQYD